MIEMIRLPENEVTTDDLAQPGNTISNSWAAAVCSACKFLWTVPNCFVLTLQSLRFAMIYSQTE